MKTNTLAALALSLSLVALPAAAQIRATLTASPAKYSGSCPATIQFRGSISAPARTIVRYRMVRSDGGHTDVITKNFAVAGAQPVTDYWQLGESYPGSEWMEVDAPVHARSNPARLSVTCNAQAASSSSLAPPSGLHSSASQVSGLHGPLPPSSALQSVGGQAAGHVSNGAYPPCCPVSMVHQQNSGLVYALNLGGPTVWEFAKTSGPLLSSRTVEPGNEITLIRCLNNCSALNAWSAISETNGIVHGMPRNASLSLLDRETVTAEYELISAVPTFKCTIKNGVREMQNVVLHFQSMRRVR